MSSSSLRLCHSCGIHRALPAALALVTVACGSDGPTTPTSAFAGIWRGETSQGQAITYTVSADERVTRLEIQYAFGNCQGVETYDNLDLPVDASNPSRAATFALGAPVSVGPNRSVYIVGGMSRAGRSANGTATFRDYPGCVNSNATWLASRP